MAVGVTLHCVCICSTLCDSHATVPDTPNPTAVQVSNQDSLKAAVDAAAEFLNKATKPVLVAGGHLRSEKAMGAFAGLFNQRCCSALSTPLQDDSDNQLL